MSLTYQERLFALFRELGWGKVVIVITSCCTLKVTFHLFDLQKQLLCIFKV